MKISEIEKQILKESEEVSIQNILKEFRLLTNDLEHFTLLLKRVFFL